MSWLRTRCSGGSCVISYVRAPHKTNLIVAPARGRTYGIVSCLVLHRSLTPHSLFDSHSSLISLLYEIHYSLPPFHTPLIQPGAASLLFSPSLLFFPFLVFLPPCPCCHLATSPRPATPPFFPPPSSFSPPLLFYTFSPSLPLSVLLPLYSTIHHRLRLSSPSRRPSPPPPSLSSAEDKEVKTKRITVSV